MNYYIYYIGGEVAKSYLGGTNYVGVWSDTKHEADLSVAKYFAVGTLILSVDKSQVKGKIGYLY